MAGGLPDALALLPKPAAIEEFSFEEILVQLRNDLVDRHPQIIQHVDLESEPTRKLLEVFAYRETVIRARCNDIVYSNLLPFAEKSDLDNLAFFYGVIRMGGESDDRFRLRTILAVEGRSTGGTEARYRFVALSADIRVADAVVYRDGRDPTVHVAIFASDNDGVPDAFLLAKVETALNATDVRMVNDTIAVRAAVFDVVNIAANLWLLPATAADTVDQLPATLRAAWARESGLGFDLEPAWIAARLMVPGVQRVEVTAPTAAVVAVPYRAIAIGTITLTVQGRAF